LLIGITIFIIFTTWQRGRELVTQIRDREEGPLPEFIAQLHAMKPPLHRCREPPSSSTAAKPPPTLAMRANVEHNEILHENVLILSVETMPAPHTQRRSGYRSTTSGTGTTGSSTSPPASATWTRRTSRASSR